MRAFSTKRYAKESPYVIFFIFLMIKLRSIFSCILRQYVTILQYDMRGLSLPGARARWLTCTCPAWNDGWISRAELTANCAGTTSMPWRRLVIDGEHYIYRVSAERAHFQARCNSSTWMYFDLSPTGAFPYFVFRCRAHYSSFCDELISVISPFFLFSSVQFVSSLWVDQVAIWS